MNNKIFLSILMALVFAACSKDRDNNPISNATQAAKDPSLQHKTFESECSTRPLTAAVTFLMSGQAVKSSRVQYWVDGSNITRSTVLFTRPDCTASPAFTFEELGTIDIKGSDQKTKDGGRSIDMNFKTLRVKMGDDDGVKAANGVKLCSSTDWASGQERDVTANAADKTCFGSQLQTEKTIYKIEGNVLYVGATGMTASQDKDGRSTSLDSTKYVQTKTSAH